MRAVSGTFIADGSAMNIDVGFVPDYIELYAALGGTELGYKWYKILADEETSGQYGIAIANAGDVSVCADADNGIIEYDTSSLQVAIPAADGDGEAKASVSDYSTSTDYSSAGQARTTSQVGTVVRPSTHNGFVYECTVAGGTGGTEPTWPTTPGETVSDNNNTWICREEKVVKGGAQGFTVGTSISSDGEIWTFKAEKHDMSGDFGDADGQDPVSLF
jgi:hypothetical protein